jgi:hypothetical protein
MSGFGWESSGGGGGSLPSGFLQVAGGVPLDGTLRTITDGVGNASPLQLSTTEVAIPTGIFTVDAQMRFNGTIYNTIDDIVKFGGAIRTATFASIGGTFTTSARLHVRGDGTNPIARFEDTGGTNGWTVNSTGLSLLPIVNEANSIGGASNRIADIYVNRMLGGASNNWSVNLQSGGFSGAFTVAQNYDYNGQKGTWMFNQTTYGTQVNSATSGTGAHIYGCFTFKPSATSTANPRGFWLEYDLNRNAQTVSGTATGIMVNATETDITGMTHNLLDLQVGGVSQFRVSRTGVTTANGFQSIAYNESFQRVGFNNGANYNSLSYIVSSAAGVIVLLDNTEVTFNRLNFGGTTNAFPAIKRNGAAIDFRLADDSGLCNINVGDLGYGANSESIAGSNNSGFTDFRSNQGWQFTNSSGGTVYNRITSSGISFGNNTLVATAQVAINSTTKGFLPPRMTTTEVNAITTPAEGLVVFNTTISHLCVYQSGGWVRMSHSPM